MNHSHHAVRWICSQIGAREHYAIPRVLYRASKLDCLYTDFWANPVWRKLGRLSGQRNLALRFHPDLVLAQVKSFNLTTLVDSIFGGSQKKNSYDWFLYVGRDFGRSVVESLRKKKRVSWKEMIFFGYDTGFLEPAQWVKTRGGKTIACQMDPSRFEVDLVKKEENLWPGWAKRSIDIPEAYLERREQEWAVADLVIVNSAWTKAALARQGVNEEKLVVVPLAYETERKARNFEGGDCASIDSENSDPRFAGPAVPSHPLRQVSSFSSTRPMRVLFFGRIILRKGIQYLIEAARMIQAEPVRFDVVGPIGISDKALGFAPSNMTFRGAVRRDQAPQFFEQADLFVLPTISDGFALTQLEAMTFGLPVIVTPNCGQVVTDGVDGMIIPARDSSQLAESFRFFVKNPAKLQEMGMAARKKVVRFSLLKLGEDLLSLERRLARPS